MANQRLCSVDGCGKPYLASGYCNAHYLRMKTHGDPLGGGPQVSPRGAPMRFIHDVVMTYEGDECLKWPFATTKGRGIVRIDGKNQVASRYVCEISHGAPPTPKHEAAHSCGNGHLGCITKRHLSWKTRKENESDKIVHGTHNRGEQSGLSKLTEQTVREIFDLKGSASQQEIAQKFGVSHQHVGRIHRGETWSWLEPTPKQE